MKTVKQILKTDSDLSSIILIDDIRDAIVGGELTDRKEIKKALEELVKRSKAEVITQFYNLTDQEIEKL